MEPASDRRPCFFACRIREALLLAFASVVAAWLLWPPLRPVTAARAGSLAKLL